MSLNACVEDKCVNSFYFSFVSFFLLFLLLYFSRDLEVIALIIFFEFYMYESAPKLTHLWERYILYIYTYIVEDDFFNINFSLHIKKYTPSVFFY